MRHTVYKLFGAWQHEKEEDWLNKMSVMGLQLIDVGFARYTFEEGTQNAYLYRLEFLEHWPSHPESIAYIRFLEDAGIEQVGTILRWVYFRKPAADGEFDLYSDLDSKIQHLRRIRRVMLVIGAANIVPCINNVNNYIQSFRYQGGASSTLLVINFIYLLLAVLYTVMLTSLTRKITKLLKEKKLRE